MAGDIIGLKSEERRRQLTILAIGAGLFALTLPLNNQRALFSPLGDVPVLGELSPVAYSVITGGPGGGAAAPRGRSSVKPGGRDVAGTPRAPSAFAARIPAEPVGQSAAATPAETAPTQLASIEPGAGGGVPGSIGDGGGGGGGASSSGGGIPGIGDIPGIGGTPNPTGAVPEPATWLTMILGFGVIGAIMRRARRREFARPAALAVSEG